MKEDKEKVNHLDIEKIGKDDEKKVSGAGTSTCPICYATIDDDYIKQHVESVHGRSY